MNALLNLRYKPFLFAIFILVYSFEAFAALEPINVTDITRGTLLSISEDRTVDDMPLLKTEIYTEVTGQIARTRISQHFKNPSDVWIEALYLFPLPPKAAVDHLRMTIGDRTIEGQIKEKEEAKATYEKAKSEGKQAALVEQDRPNIFSTSVANIPPQGDVVITIEYQESIAWRDGEFSLRFPMTITPRYSADGPAEYEIDSTINLGEGWAILPNERPHKLPLTEADATPDNDTSLKVILRPGFDIADVQSLYHQVNIESESDGVRTVTLTDGVVRADSDFVLRWTPVETQKPTVAFFSESTEKGDYGLLSLVPPTVDSGPTLQREVIFVIDTSGSMAGQSINAARAALIEGVAGLDKGDTFNIVEFNSETYSLFVRPQPAFGRSLRMAIDFIQNLEADGGTEMVPALDQALKMDGDKNRLQQVIFITDGSVSYEQTLFNKIHTDLGQKRLFTVGIGSAPNAYFMEEAARIGRGTYTYIADVGESETAMKALFNKISKPVLTDIRIASFGVSDVTPAKIPDLYAGEPLMVAMKLQSGFKRLTITGRLGNTTWRQAVVIDPVGAQAGISVDWARKMIAQWQREAYKGADQNEVKAEITALALKHHLVSPYTSLVAVDVTPVRPLTDSLDSKAIPPARPKGLKINLAKSATGFQQSLLIGFLMALFGLLLLRRRVTSE